MSKFLFALFILGITFPQFSNAQESKSEELKIYLDCKVCDNTFIKQNLGNVQLDISSFK